MDGRLLHAPKRLIYLALNKPNNTVTTVSDPQQRTTVMELLRGVRERVYPVGRLDYHSEGLLLLTDDGRLQAGITDPRHALEKTYWAQVEGAPGDVDLEPLRRPMDLGDFVTLPARARLIEEPPGLWPRDPPIRFRKAIPTTWIELVLNEGKNRQARRMTARAGFPTLRLIRAAIGAYRLGALPPGKWREAVPDRG